MNAVIIYDDFACASKAKATFERAAQQSEEAAHWNVKPWRVDMLNGSSPAAGVALAEAADAHLIVFVLRQARSLPVGLMDWLTAWAERRQVEYPALAVWNAENSASGSTPATAELAAFARRFGLGVIAGATGPAEADRAQLAGGLHEREAAVTRKRKHYLDAPARGSCRPSRVSE